MYYIGENNYPIFVDDLKNGLIEINNSEELTEYIYAKIIEYSKMEKFSLKDFLEYLKIKIPIDRRTEQLLELYYYNLTNPIDYNITPYPVYIVIVTLNSLRDAF